tara:strand:+ start:198 stop:530 length:333 start_codon:yes stop_codon:yes gene_type:complete
MLKRLFSTTKPELTALEKAAIQISEEFRSGELVGCNLDFQGISSMAVSSNKVFVSIRWFGRRDRLFSLDLNGIKCFPEGKETDMILEAAVGRAKEVSNSEMLKILKDPKP